jgi:pantothenate kinase type III
MENDVNVESTAESLSRHVPKYAHDVIFGISENGTAKAALEASRKRPEAARLFSVYIISTNLDQLQYLARLWSDVPCRIFQLEGDAFYSAEDGRYDGMGVDRLATLRGAGEQWGYPALVFDGGTATTYTAADSNGHIMGGGIGPGVALKVGSLGEGCDALPDISPLEFMQRMEDAMADKEKPLPIFASNTREAMMGQIMSETAHACRNVIKHWLELVGPDEREAAKQAKQARKKSTGRKMNFVKGSPENTQRNVIVTGGDGELISHLIQWNYSGILEGRSPIVARGFTVILSKYVIHYGIQAALMDRVRDRWNLEDKERFLNGEDKEKKDVNQLYVSKRVAKWFKDADANGSHYYRGTITKVFEGLGGKGTPTILFHIEFDDGDEEDAEIEELDGAYSGLFALFIGIRFAISIVYVYMQPFTPFHFALSQQSCSKPTKGLCKMTRTRKRRELQQRRRRRPKGASASQKAEARSAMPTWTPTAIATPMAKPQRQGKDRPSPKCRSPAPGTNPTRGQNDHRNRHSQGLTTLQILASFSIRELPRTLMAKFITAPLPLTMTTPTTTTMMM